jgi:hypothetical protein
MAKSDKELAIKKWEWIVENMDALLILHKGSAFIPERVEHDVKSTIPEIRGLKAGCSYCETHCVSPFNCGECPLAMKENVEKAAFDCLKKGHPYNVWKNNLTKKTAQKMLDFIKERG